jgi:hypothetical protein
MTGARRTHEDPAIRNWVMVGSLKRRLAAVAKLLEKGKTVQAYRIASDTRQ